MSTFYQIDSTRVSHREYWWGTHSPLVLIGWLSKWLGIRLPSSSDDPNVESTLPFVVPALPDEVARRFNPLADELAALGFVDPVYQLIRDPGTSTTHYWATFRHGSGQHFARIHQRIWQQAKPADRGTFVTLFTAFADATFVVTSSAKADLAVPPAIRLQRKLRARPAQLWAAHEPAVAAAWSQPVQPVRTRDELLAAGERLHTVLRDFHLARGVFRPLNAEEQASADAYAATVAQAQANGLEHAEVLAELERLQTRKPGWGNALVILGVSIIAFFAAGTAQWDWSFTLWLIPVLLLHEAGHWVAMKVFRYRNLRMFFIPLFGAAVTGQNWNVPGWKKALVSLAGPLPGIALGVVLMIVGLVTRQAWLNQAAWVLLFLNGFNLLPALPLDGGHVLHATLFCRNRWLDIAFRIAAVAVLVLLSAVGLGKLFLLIAIPMALSLPVAFKLGQVTDRLRGTPLPPPLPGEDRIPLATAQAIIGAVKAALPPKTNDKLVAQHTLNVFETLNARPPGAGATLGLLALHGASVLVATLCWFLLVMDRFGGGLDNFMRTALRQPEHELPCGGHRQWAGEAAAAVTARNTVVATFAAADDAGRTFGQLTNRLPPTASLSCFGDSLLLTLPADDDAAREQWFNELQSAATNVFVALTNRTVGLSLMGVAPDEAAATRIEQELQDYLQVANFGELLAPWAPGADEPAFASARQARRTWSRIAEATTTPWDDPKIKAIATQLTAAQRRGARAEVERLLAEQQRLVKTLVAQAYARLRQEGFDATLLELHNRLSTVGFTNQTERAAVLEEVAARLGPVPRDGGRPNASAARYSATFGHVTRHGLVLEASWISFKDPAAAVPALADWLCQQRCQDLKYDLESGPAYADLDE